MNTSQIKKDFFEALSEVQKADIEAGLKDLEAGRKKKFDKVIAKYK